MVKFELPAVTEIASKNGGEASKKMNSLQKADSSALQKQQQQATEHLLRFFPALQQQLLAQHYFVRTCKDIEREICVNNVLDAANQSRCNALIALLHKNLTNDTLRQHQQRAMGGERPIHGILKPVTNICANDDAAGTATQRKTRFFLRYKYSIPSGVGNAGSDSSSVDTPITADDSVVRYTRKQLFHIGQNSASKVQPKCLETNRFFNIRKDMKRTVTGAANDRESSSRDPKERLRKENDGIVLSPQRRSFHMGCQMPSAPSTGNQPQIGAPNLIRGERNDLLNPSRERRFGSGRILPRDVSWDYRPSGSDKDKSVLGEPQSSSEYGGSGGYRNSSSASGGRSENYRGNDRDGNNDRYDRYDRRSYGRGEYDRSNDKENQPSRGSGNDRNNRIVNRFQSMGGGQSDKDQRGVNDRFNNADYHHGGGGGGYGNNNRRRLHSGDEEPEWFSGGPTSQHDTIELRGFDDPLNEESAEKSGGSKKRSDDSLSDDLPPTNRRSSNQGDSNKEEDRAHEERVPVAVKLEQETDEGRPSSPPARSTPTKLNDNNNNNNGEKLEERKKQISEGEMGEEKMGENHNDFIEEFLKMDSISGLLVDDEFPNKEAGGGSRFSRWFRRDSPSGMMGGGPPAHMQLMGGANVMQHFDSPRHALHDELNNMVNDFPPMIMIPGGNVGGGNNDSNKYFAPISPAANTNNSLLEMLQRGSNAAGSNMADELKQQNQLLSQMFGLQQQQQQQQSSSQMPSVEELEARLRGPPDNSKHMRDHQMLPNQQQHQQQQPGQSQAHPPNQDMHAFKKLLAQMSDNPISNQHQQQQQANLIQLLNKQQPPNQEELKKVFPFMFQPQRSQSRIMPPAGVPINKQDAGPQQMVQQPQSAFGGSSQPQQQMPRNEVMQALMRTLGQQQPQQSHLQANPMDQCAEILKRPEAQTILNGLVSGEVNHFQLHQQMLSPNLSQRQREVIQAVLAVCKNSPRVGSPNLMIPPIGGAPIPIPPPIGSAGPNPGDMQPHLLFQHHAQKQQMRLSPLPNAFSVPSAAAVPPTNNPLTLHIPGAPQRIPSPRELQYHTQSIMQNALIRKKLEEQRENFRKRQEQQGGVVAPNVSVGQPSANGTMASTTLASIVAGTVSMAPNNMTSSASIVNPSGPVAACIEKPAIASPTLAFTPTSVLRKMTAEKDPDSTNNLATSMMSSSASTSSLASSVSSHPSTINSGGNVMMNNGKNFPGGVGPQSNQAAQRMNQQIVHMAQMRQQHQQQQQGGGVTAPGNANMNWSLNQLMQMKPQGRPIVKGSGNQQPTNQIPMASNLEFQQQQFQRQKQQQQHQNQGIPQQQQQQQQQLPPQMANNAPNMLMGGGGGNSQQPMPMNNQQQIQQLLQHRQQQQRAMQQFQWMQQQQQQNQQGHMDSNRNVNATTNASGVAPITAANLMNFNRDQLSPTSNQLARWFSPELLAKAKAGNLPTLNVEQTLSLEEFERSIQHSSATVHN